MYGSPLTISGRDQHQHDATGGGGNAHGSTGSSPSRPISSPITPSSANLTRQLHGLMPIDQTFAYGGHFASVAQLPHGHSHGHGHGGHQLGGGIIGGPSPAHNSSASLQHSTVIHEPHNATVAKMLAATGHGHVEGGHGHGSLHLNSQAINAINSSNANEQGDQDGGGHHGS